MNCKRCQRQPATHAVERNTCWSCDDCLTAAERASLAALEPRTPTDEQRALLLRIVADFRERLEAAQRDNTWGRGVAYRRICAAMQNDYDQTKEYYDAREWVMVAYMRAKLYFPEPPAWVRPLLAELGAADREARQAYNARWWKAGAPERRQPPYEPDYDESNAYGRAAHRAADYAERGQGHAPLDSYETYLATGER